MSRIGLGVPKLLDFGIAIALVPVGAMAAVPVTYPPPVLTEVTINDSTGDQTQPHVSGDWAAYTAGISIHYYDFGTGVDSEIPMGDSVRDLLSDVSGSRIVFSRIFMGIGIAIMVFDAGTGGAPIELDPMDGSNRFGSAIGGDIVAYVDYGLEENGELVIHDLAASTANRVTFDDAADQNPSVSPSGDVVVWERCAATSLTNCDIWQAVKTGTGWSVSAVSDSSTPEGNPDSNGDLVVYDTGFSGTADFDDVFWRPVSGGAEVQLQWPGIQRNPSIAGDFITFESRASASVAAKWDLFVYDVVNNRLFQITDTPLVSERLNDMALLPDGRLRVVWASDEEGNNVHNIRAATFELPRDAPGQIADLITLVLSFNLKQGIENSLDAKLQNVLAALDAAGAGDETTACNKLEAFIHEVQAQTDKAITAAEAAQLIAATNQVKATLGCP